MKKKKQKVIWYTIIAFTLGIIVLFLVNNFTVKKAYEVVSCTYNQYSCEAPAWNGQCTDEIRDQCCIDVRICGGTVGNPMECYTKYCTASNNFCKPFSRIDGLWDCRCADINDEQVVC